MAVREGLLALLDPGPRHGYGLKTEFETATGGTWPLNVGQVYTTLERLERDRLIIATGDDAQRAYELTAAGRAALGEWWDAVPGDEPPPRDELVMKVLVAVAVDPELALDVIAKQRSAVLTLLQQRRRRAPSSASLAEQLVTDALAVRAEADLRWLDMCEERLGQPAPRRGGRR
jgi:DNA-binding PadR family transcriptional regulator